MYNLVEYSDNYLKTSGVLWQFYRDVSALDDDDVITDFTEDNATTKSSNVKVKLSGQTGNNGTKKLK